MARKRAGAHCGAAEEPKEVCYNSATLRLDRDTLRQVRDAIVLPNGTLRTRPQLIWRMFTMAGTGAPMSIPLRDWIAIISSVALNASAQIFLRSGMRGTQIGSLITSSDFRGVLGLFFNLYILGGMACYAVSVLLWMYVLSQQPVGIAYPMMSLAYLFATILGWIFLGESFSALRLLGLACIMIGVWIIARSTT